MKKVEKGEELGGEEKRRKEKRGKTRGGVVIDRALFMA